MEKEKHFCFFLSLIRQYVCRVKRGLIPKEVSAPGLTPSSTACQELHTCRHGAAKELLPTPPTAFSDSGV